MLLGDLKVPEECSVIFPILSKIGNKWTILVILLLAEEPKRYNQLKREIKNVSQKMLTQTLRLLEEDGLINRRVFAEMVPPSVEYSLSKLGYDLLPHIVNLCQWATNNHEAICKNRIHYQENAKK